VLAYRANMRVTRHNEPAWHAAYAAFREVLPEMLLCFLGFAVGDGLHDQPMMHDNILCLARSGKMQAAQAIDMPAAAAHERP